MLSAAGRRCSRSYAPEAWLRASRAAAWRGAAAAGVRQRIAIVTGSAQGLGESIARELARQGDKVIVADVQEELGAEVAKSVGGEFVPCDITDAKAVQQIIEGAASRHGSVDVVVASAGTVHVPKPTHVLSLEEWESVNKVNGFGTFVTVKYALTQMLKQPEGGVILAMSSVCGMTGHGGTSAYNFTKAGIISLTKTVACEYREKNIRMNCILPNTCETPMVIEYLKNTDDATRALFYKFSPVPGLIQPSHVAEGAAFLCSPNKFLTGVALPVDGGYLAAAPSYENRPDYLKIFEGSQDQAP